MSDMVGTELKEKRFPRFPEVFPGFGFIFRFQALKPCSNVGPKLETALRFNVILKQHGQNGFTMRPQKSKSGKKWGIAIFKIK